jgi:hypothetical protein
MDATYIYVAPLGQTPIDGGWIRLQRPRVDAETLYLSQHDLRTADADMSRLFDRIRRRWATFVSRPVRATNVLNGGASTYKDVGFTAGALDLFDAGWAWQQDGVANVSFEPDPSAPRPQRIA